MTAPAGAADRGVPRAPARGVVLYSDSVVIADGIVGLLPEGWGEHVAVAAELSALQDLVGPGSPVIVDAETDGAAAAVAAVAALGGSVILLLGPSSERLPSEVLDAADAILRRDEAGPLMLRAAFAAGRVGMRLVPRVAPAGTATPAVPLGESLTEAGRQVLALLSKGKRDAEIARDMNLSESAVRKLVQRTVRAVGARTRCQAVAFAARAGEFDEGHVSRLP